MSRATKGCGCAVAVLVLLLIPAGYVGWKYVYPWWKMKPPPASGGELQVHVLDVGPINGDSILIISPGGKTVLIDAGDAGKGKVVLEALKRYNVQQLDYFIATHPHPDHIGGADEVIKATKVLNVIDNGLGADVPESLAAPPKSAPKPASTSSGKKPATKKLDRSSAITKFYDEYREAVTQSGAHYEKAVPGAKYDLGSGARLTILGPGEPYFTREQMKGGGNLPNANSVVARLDYGDFSMLLPGDAEEQTEHRMLTKDQDLKTKILKVAHHGSKYATSQDFLDRVKPVVAIISCGEWNRYGHPSQAVLDRLRAANVKLYRTDLQGEITITTRGKQSDEVIKTAKEAKTDLWLGRVAQKDDSTRSGFIAYGDFGPPPQATGRKRYSLVRTSNPRPDIDMTTTAKQGFSTRLNTWLEGVGKSRDGILVVGGALYILGYIVWSVNAYINKLGLLPAFESQYFIAGIVPFIIIFLVFYSIKYSWTRDLHLPPWLNILKTRKWWSDISGAVLPVAFILYNFFWKGNDDLKKFFSERLTLIGGILASVAGLLFLLTLFSIDVGSDDPLKVRAGRTGKKLIDKFVVALRFAITVVFLFVMGTVALGFYVSLIYSQLPQSLGGVRPRCAYLDIQKTGVSVDTLKAVLPPGHFELSIFNTQPGPSSGDSPSSAPTSNTEIIRTDRVEVLFSGSDYSLIRVQKNVFEIKKDVIHAVQSCD